ncbi:hypothetical protein [Aggregatibacter actinomycetemcomitans]|uniref:hypothetical protein n=1 Tax=Aggregatibacter actinomycetemcomitans TaxID=714 RepID=UPI00023FF19B|nr:hypothetical protein [Aggregatibacter actinomycetemcomitans]EHK90613.1 hypothetical protein RHAA1_02386 [Aggregatibacter actinomycetemcomitans RhAA1]KNE77661.1 hypothetical protein RHAA2_02425 [Aggregatibacter actinomycetemcomitans RhAA1]
MSNLTEQWENGTLGRDEKFVKKSGRTRQDLDEKLALQPISIRLPKELIQDLKDIAQINGLGYQPLIKQILNRFVDAEKKIMANERISELKKLSNEIEKCSKRKIA